MHVDQISVIMGVVFGKGKQPNTTYLNYKDTHSVPKFIAPA